MKLVSIGLLSVVAFGWIGGLASAAEDHRLLAVRVIKQHICPAANQPTMRATLGGRTLEPHRDPHPEYGPRYFGINPYEFYFHLAIPGGVGDRPQIEVDWPGVKIRRVLVGSADVDFQETAGRITFTAPLDFARNTMVISSFVEGEMGRGGIQIPLCHHREASAAGYYRPEALPEFPWTGVRAANNLAFAFREVLLLSGLHGEALGSEGGWSLNTFESTFEHGHVDAPPHVHATLLPGKGRLDWSRHQASHFRFDSRGRITHNDVHDRSPTGMRHERYGPGERWVVENFRTGQPLAFFTVQKDGSLAYRRADNEHVYRFQSLDGETGFSEGVMVERGGAALCHVKVEDWIEHGKTRVEVHYLRNAERSGYREILRYDRDTGERLRRTKELLPIAE